ncbi:MAG TPA: peptidyl-prolyl cis-trans isomerase [Gemmatimonadaceae bacterium]|nr:peptidyl-prolyl cis-trans isomerase [Gemmatimonadaceae bacterium]
MRSAAFTKVVFWVLAFAFVGGFLLLDSSGLLGRDSITPGTAVASVNGRDIPYGVWSQLAQNLAQQQEERLGRALTLDERNRIDDQAFEQLVTEVLLEQEYDRRGIRVTDDEIRQYALTSPPPELMRAPDLQTDGRFDYEKYQRWLTSPAAKQGGLLLQLESYYRTEIPRQKLIDQVASDVYLTKPRLWAIWQDAHDSAQISFVAFRPEPTPEAANGKADSSVKVSDAELRQYFDAHEAEFERPGRAAVSIISIPRQITPADSAAVRARAAALRAEIVGGVKFEDVARRESSDTISGRDGGSLGRGPRGRFVAEFENAAFALRPGELSQPVLTPFGYHLIKVDERKGDTLALRHILLRITQSDSTATATDRKADQLSQLAAGATEPAKFDSAARSLQLLVTRATAIEGEPLTVAGRYIPSVSAWAFSGVRPGETSDLMDADDAYYLARLDTLVDGGKPSFDAVKDEIRQIVVREKRIQQLVPQAKQLASAAASSSLEQAAQSRDATVEKSPAFTRVTPVPGIGQFTEVVGAAFGLPVGAVSDAITARNGVYVIRVDRRVNASRDEFEKQFQAQRGQLTQGLREQRSREFLDNLRKAADLKDNRKKIQAAQRRTTT